MNDPTQSLAIARLIVLAMPLVLLIGAITDTSKPEQTSGHEVAASLEK